MYKYECSQGYRQLHLGHLCRSSQGQAIGRKLGLDKDAGMYERSQGQVYTIIWGTMYDSSQGQAICRKLGQQGIR